MDLVAIVTNVAILFTRDKSELVVNSTSNAVNKFERKTSGKGAVRVRKGFTLFVWMKIWIILLKS